MRLDEFQQWVHFNLPDAVALLEEDTGEIILHTRSKIYQDGEDLFIGPLKEATLPDNVINLHDHPKFQAAHHGPIPAFEIPDFEDD